MYLTLIGERVDEIVYDAVGTEALCFGQQTQQGGNLKSHRIVRFLRVERQLSALTCLRASQSGEILHSSHSNEKVTCWHRKQCCMCENACPGLSRVLYLIVVFQQDPDDPLHALRLHGLACKLE